MSQKILREDKNIGGFEIPPTQINSKILSQQTPLEKQVFERNGTKFVS